jgi:hypothetical protein
MHLIVLIGIVLALFIQGPVSAAQTECPPSQFDTFGSNGVVTPGAANRLREEPSLTSPVIGQLAPGVPFNIRFQRTACADGYLWVGVRTINQEGWTVERAIDGDLFVVPYEGSDPRQIGARLDDGTYRVDEIGLSMTLPAEWNIESVLMVPVIGFFGDVMSARPSAISLTFVTAGGELVPAELQIFPYELLGDVFDLYWSDNLDVLLTERPDLLGYAASNRIPQSPIGGTAALFGGAGAYLAFGGGTAVRFLTYFAQTSVLFTAEDRLDYLYRGLTDDRAFLIVGSYRGVAFPADSIPGNGSLNDDAYSVYLRQFEANLSALPQDAFTPHLGLIDSLFTTLTVTNTDALIDALPFQRP